MRLRVVGCAGGMPGPASPASCYLLEADEGGRTWRVALDLGNGSLGSLQRWCDPRELDAVAISHLHADHCADLASLHVYLRHHPDGAAQPVPLYAPFGTPSRLAQLRGTQEPSAAFEIHAWQSAAATEVGPFNIACEAVEHPVPAYAMRITGPREDGSGDAVITYSGDSDSCEGLDRAAEGADLFVCEATYLTGNVGEPGSHLTARRAGETAARAGVGRLVLTHVPPWTDPNDTFAEARAEFTGDMVLAVPGLLLAV